MVWYQPASEPRSPSCDSSTALLFVMWKCETSYFAIPSASSVITRAVSHGSQATPSASRTRARRPLQRATGPSVDPRSPDGCTSVLKVIGEAVSSAPDGIGGCLHVADTTASLRRGAP